jgi:cobalt-zinc-cadmium efflux system outer membrane protein
MHFMPRLFVLAAAALLAACAVPSLERSAASSAELAAQAGAPAPSWTDAGTPEPDPAEPLTLEAALVTAFGHNPRVREAYARLGITQADLQAAARIANPSLSLAWLDAGSLDKDRAGIVASFTDLLLLPSRRRLATGDMKRVELAVAGELVVLAGDVTAAWYEHVAARRVATVLENAADAAEISAELARRYHAAGNIPELEVKLRESAAAEAHIEALHADAATAAARARLADLLGLSSTGRWQTAEDLPAPLAEGLDAGKLAESAREKRLDLAALRQEVATSEEALVVARRYAWLGGIDVGYEREEESDGTFRGPTLSLELPIFDQGQPERSRAAAELEAAAARRAALDLEIGTAVASAVAKVEAERVAVDRRREALQAASAATERLQESTAYMLTGVFELLEARGREYEANAAWLGALRDYWVARSALAVAVGGTLPAVATPVDDDMPAEEVKGGRS